MMSACPQLFAGAIEGLNIMKRWSFGLVGALCAGLACATIDNEAQGARPSASAASATGQAAPARPAVFAASSLASVRRLTPEEREEWRFLKEASAAGRFELDASRLALTRAGDAKVRSLAASLVEHHAAAQPRLQQMLAARSMATPMISGDQRKALNRLGKLQGAKFDREWLAAVGMRSQQDALATYERAAQSASDPALRGWVEQVLPAVRSQTQAAERIAGGGTKYARIAPSPRAVIKAPAPTVATRYVAAVPAATTQRTAASTVPASSARMKVDLTEPSTR
jgi:predicted outer membrane protein